MTDQRASTPAPNATTASNAASPRLSLDAWAVIVALALSAAIWLGWIKHVPW